MNKCEEDEVKGRSEGMKRMKHSAFSQTCNMQALAGWLSALLTYIH